MVVWLGALCQSTLIMARVYGGEWPDDTLVGTTLTWSAWTWSNLLFTVKNNQHQEVKEHLVLNK